MPSESTPKSHFGDVIEKQDPQGNPNNPQYWVITGVTSNGEYMSHALYGYKPGQQPGPDLEILISQGGNTIQGELPPRAGHLDLPIIRDAAERHIKNKVPPPLQDWMRDQTVRRWPQT